MRSFDGPLPAEQQDPIHRDPDYQALTPAGKARFAAKQALTPPAARVTPQSALGKVLYSKPIGPVPPADGVDASGSWDDAPPVTPSVGGDLASRRIDYGNLQPGTTPGQMALDAAKGVGRGALNTYNMTNQLLTGTTPEQSIAAMAPAPPVAQQLATGHPVTRQVGPLGRTPTPEQQTLDSVNNGLSLVRGLTYGPVLDAYSAAGDLAAGNAITPSQPMGFPGSATGAGEALAQSLPGAVGETLGMTAMDPILGLGGLTLKAGAPKINGLRVKPPAAPLDLSLLPQPLEPKPVPVEVPPAPQEAASTVPHDNPPAPVTPEPAKAPVDATPRGARRGSLGTGPEPQRVIANRIENLQRRIDAATSAGDHPEAARLTAAKQHLQDAHDILGDAEVFPEAAPAAPDTRTYPNTVDPTDHINPNKWDALDDPATSKLHQVVADTVAAMTQDHKAPRSGDDLQAKAAQITDQHIHELVKQGYQEGRPLSEDEYAAVQNRLADLMPRIVELEQQTGGPAFMGDNADIRKQLREAEESAKGLIGLLSPSRSDKGRALAYLKEQAKQGFNSDYWMSRAHRASGGDLSGHQISTLAEILERGKKADALHKSKLAEADSLRKRRVALEQNDAGIEATPGAEPDMPAPVEAHDAPPPAPEVHPLDALLQEFTPKAWDPTASRAPKEPKPRGSSPERPATLPKSVKDLADYLKAEGAARIERNKGVMFMSSLGVGHADLVFGHAQVLAGEMLHRAIEFSTWAKEMHAEHGDAVIQHLPKIWNQAEKLATRALSGKPIESRGATNERIRLVKDSDTPKPSTLGGIVDRARAEVDKAAHDRTAAEAKAADQAHADAEAQVQKRKDQLAAIVDRARKDVAADHGAHEAALERSKQELADAMGKAREAAAQASAKADTHAQSAASRAAERAADRAAAAEVKAAEKAVSDEAKAKDGEVQKLGEEMGKAREAAEKARANAAAAEGRAADKATQAKAQAEVDAAEKAVKELGEEMGRAREAAAKARQRADNATQGDASKATERAKSDEVKAAEKAARDEERASLKAAEKAARAHAKAHAASVRQANIDLAKHMASLEPDGMWKGGSEALRAGLISSVRTLAKVSISHNVHITLEGLAKAMAAPVDAGISLVKGTPRTILSPTPGKVAAAAKEALTRGLAESKQILQHGATEDDLAEMKLPRELNTRFPWLNAYVNGIYRVHGAVYHPYHVYAFTRALQDQALILAREEAKATPDLDVKAHAQALMANPTPEMVAEATAAGAFITFSEENRVAEGFADFKRRLNPGGKFALDRLVPFSHVPSNILARVLDYAIVGGVFRVPMAVARAKAAGALTAADQKIIAGAIGRGLVGTPLIYLGAKLGAAGLVSGTFDRATQQANDLANRPADSIKMFGHWVNVASLTPFGELLVMGATMAREGNDKYAYPQVAADTVLDAPMLQGVQSLHDAREQGNPAPLAASFAGSLVPTMVSDVASAFDANKRQNRKDTMGAMQDAVQARIPGLRNRLPAKENALGDKVPSTTADGLGGLNAFGPLAGQRDMVDSSPVIQHLLATGLVPPKPPKTVKIDNPNPAGDDLHVAITEEEQRAIRHDTGIRFGKAVEKLLADPRHMAKGTDDQREDLHDELRDAHQDAIEAFTAGHASDLAGRAPQAEEKVAERKLRLKLPTQAKTQTDDTQAKQISLLRKSAGASL